MTDYLLDTNHISPLVTIEHPLRTKILVQVQAGDTFSIGTPALIAVIALRNDLTLLTSDKDFSVIEDLKQENWRISP